MNIFELVLIEMLQIWCPQHSNTYRCKITRWACGLLVYYVITLYQLFQIVYFLMKSAPITNEYYLLDIQS